jgi:hypothetical protein
MGQECTVYDYRKQKYFCTRDWTVDPALNPLANFGFSRESFRAFSCARAARSGENRATDLPDK